MTADTDWEQGEDAARWPPEEYESSHDEAACILCVARRLPGATVWREAA